MPDTIEGRVLVLETKLSEVKEVIHTISTNIDILMESEASRKATDRVIGRYLNIAFWAVVSIGGFINWDKIQKAIDHLTH